MPGVLSNLAGGMTGTFASSAADAAARLAGSQPLSMANTTPDVGNRTIRPTFFAAGGTGQRIAGILGDALLGATGHPGVYAATMHQQQVDARQHQQDMLDDQLKKMQIDALTRKAGQPQTEHVGDAFGIVDPDTGGFNPTYIAPTDAERYALSMGAQRGTPDWMKHLSDFTLHANGPTAYGQDQDMERLRQSGRVSLEGVRQSGRTTLKALPTYGQTHPRLPGGPTFGSPGLASVPTGNLISQLGN